MAVRITMDSLPLKKETINYTEIALRVNELIDALSWILPTINPSCGEVEPTEAGVSGGFLRAGTLAYANGTDWDPGSGEGLYLYNSGGTWTKVG